MTIETLLDSIYRLPEDSKNRLVEVITKVEYPKGHSLFSARKLERDIYFIKQGIVHAYTDTAEKDITFWFGREGESIYGVSVSLSAYSLVWRY